MSDAAVLIARPKLCVVDPCRAVAMLIGSAANVLLAQINEIAKNRGLANECVLVFMRRPICPLQFDQPS
jgi:hypothetical protein